MPTKVSNERKEEIEKGALLLATTAVNDIVAFGTHTHLQELKALKMDHSTPHMERLLNSTDDPAIQEKADIREWLQKGRLVAEMLVPCFRRSALQLSALTVLQTQVRKP